MDRTAGFASLGLAGVVVVVVAVVGFLLGAALLVATLGVLWSLVELLVSLVVGLF